MALNPTALLRINKALNKTLLIIDCSALLVFIILTVPVIGFAILAYAYKAILHLFHSVTRFWMEDGNGNRALLIMAILSVLWIALRWKRLSKAIAASGRYAKTEHDNSE